MADKIEALQHIAKSSTLGWYSQLMQSWNRGQVEGPFVIVAGPTSGKSTVRTYLKLFGALVWDTDDLEVHTDAWFPPIFKGGEAEHPVSSERSEKLKSFILSMILSQLQTQNVPAVIFTNLRSRLAFTGGVSYFRKDPAEIAALMMARDKTLTSKMSVNELSVITEKWTRSLRTGMYNEHRWLSKGQFMCDSLPSNFIDLQVRPTAPPAVDILRLPFDLEARELNGIPRDLWSDTTKIENFIKDLAR